MKIFRFGPLDGQGGIPSSFAGQPVFECPLKACLLVVASQGGRLWRGSVGPRVRFDVGDLRLPARPLRARGARKSGRLSARDNGFGSRTTSDLRAMTV
jgi:hypothetical protein